MKRSVVITGVGLITPLGTSGAEVLGRLRGRESAIASPRTFDATALECQVCAEVRDFDPAVHVPEPKMVRMMNRDALLAVAAARLAVCDARLLVGTHYRPEDVALFGATGLTGVALSEVVRLVQGAAGPQGLLDLHRFGEVVLKQVRPVLSFKILSNMPVCFVSIFERAQGPNAVYNPWEGHGAQALARAVRSIARGDALAALAVGCDVKTRELGFIGLQQCGALAAWRRCGVGTVPGEGAGVLVLEEEAGARARGAQIYARVSDCRLASVPHGAERSAVYRQMIGPLVQRAPTAIVSAADGDPDLREAEAIALETLSVHAERTLRPKLQLGNLFAAAAAVQCALGALLASELRGGERVLVNCLGFGSEQGAFVLEAP